MGTQTETSLTLTSLTLENFSKGFLIDDEVIGGVTQLADTNGAPVYAAYMSHYLTGETMDYQEFSDVEAALAFINGIGRDWKFEAIGCSDHGNAANACGKGCNSCSC